ncbi:MAG TPA: membrane dipeptidase [Clostridiaceae bacterium]|nr:membrane dipeptidase [Clostridiaceae bacterium]
MLLDLHGDIWTDVTVKRLEGMKSVIKTRHLEKFRKGGLSGGVFIVWSDPPHDKRSRDRMIESLGAMSAELWENKDIIQVVTEPDHFLEAVAADKLGVMLGIEGLSSIGTDVEMIYAFERMGFRLAMLTWNETNDLSTGPQGDPDRGLTDYGREAVRIMNELKMIVDVAHTNEKSFWDIIETSSAPVIASHSNVRELCDVPRNLWNDQIDAIRQKEGMVGINVFNEFVSKDKSEHTLERLVDHIDYLVERMGVDYVGFGFDFDDYLNLDTLASFSSSPDHGLEGLQNIGDAPNLLAELERRGYSSVDIKKLSGENFINFYRRIRS